MAEDEDKEKARVEEEKEKNLRLDKAQEALEHAKGLTDPSDRMIALNGVLSEYGDIQSIKTKTDRAIAQTEKDLNIQVSQKNKEKLESEQKEQTPEEKLLEDIKDLGNRTKALNSEIAELKKGTGQDVAVLGQMLNDLEKRAPTPQDREIVEQIEQKQKEREEERKRLEERLKKLKEEREQKQADLDKFEKKLKDRDSPPEKKQVLDLRITQSKETLITIHLDLMKGENDLKEIDDNLKGIGKLVNAVKAVFKKSEKEKAEEAQKAEEKADKKKEAKGDDIDSLMLSSGSPKSEQGKTGGKEVQTAEELLLERLDHRFGEDYPKEVVAATGKMIGSFTDSPEGRPQNTTAQAIGKAQETKKETQKQAKPKELTKPPAKGPKNQHDKGFGR